MRVDVVVFATLRKYVPGLELGKTMTVEVQPGTTMAQVIEILGLPVQEVKVVMRNNLQADADDEVQDGDRVAFIPSVAGG